MKLDPIKLPDARRKGFEIADFSIHFEGYCPECRRKKDKISCTQNRLEKRKVVSVEYRCGVWRHRPTSIPLHKGGHTADKPFLTDVNTLRSRARQHIEQGAVTPGYRADRDKVVQILNEALYQLLPRRSDGLKVATMCG